MRWTRLHHDRDHTTRAVVAASVLLAIGGCVAVAEHSPPATMATGMPHHAQVHAASPTSAAFQREMDVGMARMMQDMHAPGYVGNPDIDFLAMMIPHHAGAVDMARLVLEHGRDPATRRLAEEIIAGQTIEIEGMTRRLAALRQQGTAGDVQEFPALGGTRGR